MRRLLDTDVLIDIDRRLPSALEWISGQESLPAVSGFAAMELLQACEDKVRIAGIQRFLAPFDRLWPSTRACERALSLYSDLHLSSGLGLVDALIAATSLEHEAELCTFNLRHYRAVPGLKVVAPYVRKVS